MFLCSIRLSSRTGSRNCSRMTSEKFNWDNTKANLKCGYRFPEVVPHPQHDSICFLIKGFICMTKHSRIPMDVA